MSFFDSTVNRQTKCQAKNNLGMRCEREHERYFSNIPPCYDYGVVKVMTHRGQIKLTVTSWSQIRAQEQVLD